MEEVPSADAVRRERVREISLSGPETASRVGVGAWGHDGSGGPSDQRTTPDSRKASLRRGSTSIDARISSSPSVDDAR